MTSSPIVASFSRSLFVSTIDVVADLSTSGPGTRTFDGSEAAGASHCVGSTERSTFCRG